MTYEEAIEHFKKDKEVFRGKDYEAATIAIRAIEKQIPKKPIQKEGTTYFYCPCCQNGGIDIFCDKCGQHLDWSEE